MEEGSTDLASLCGPASNPVCRVTVPPGACIRLSFLGPRLSAPVEALGAWHSMQKVSAGLLRHKCSVSKNTALRDSRPPHQSMTEGSSWPGGLAQDVHPQPRSQGTSQATHAHVGIPTDLPTLCSRRRARADSEFVGFQGDAKSTQTTLPYLQHAKRTPCPQGKAMPSGYGRC